MSRRLAETTVQAAAIDYLSGWYRGMARKGKVFSKLEARTKSAHGSKRADGLVAFRHWLWGTFVVSIEAKSFKTLEAMRPRHDWKLFFTNCLRAGLLICILSGAFFILYKWDDGFYQYLIPGAGFVAGTISYGILTRRHYGHKVVDVVEQSKQYPANERWLAFSRDSLRALSPAKRDMLERICRYQGVGIVSVRRNRRVDILLRPRRRWTVLLRDFLVFYAREKHIRGMIE